MNKSPQQPRCCGLNKWMEFIKTKRTFSILAVIACSAGISQAAVVQPPYSADANTLHLWHLDQTANPLADPAAARSLNLLKGIQ